MTAPSLGGLTTGWVAPGESLPPRGGRTEAVWLKELKPMAKPTTKRRRGTSLIDCLIVHATVQFPDVNCHLGLMLPVRTHWHAPCDTIPHLSWLGCEPTHCAPMGQCEVQIQVDGGRHWAVRSQFTGNHECLIPRMHGSELVCFRCGMPAAGVSILLIECLVDY